MLNRIEFIDVKHLSPKHLSTICDLICVDIRSRYQKLEKRRLKKQNNEVDASQSENRDWFSSFNLDEFTFVLFHYSGSIYDQPYVSMNIEYQYIEMSITTVNFFEGHVSHQCSTE